MPIDPDVAIGAELGSVDFSWTESDVLLYHLGIGATDLSYTLEGPALQVLPEHIAAILEREPEIAKLAERFVGAEHAFYVGRAAGHAIAQEGALKLKEISYLHAEAYPASELKHGPLALIEPGTPTVMVLPRDDLFSKNLSTVEEIKARGGPVIAITHPGEAPAFDGVFEVPALEPELDPLLLNIPLQLLAYHVALQRGTNIDQPRNLAKSVTVE